MYAWGVAPGDGQQNEGPEVPEQVPDIGSRVIGSETSGSGAHPASSSGYRRVKVTTYLQPVPRSRKRGSVHAHPHTPSWRSAQREIRRAFGRYTQGTDGEDVLFGVD
jgi:hypothetical protein